MTTQTSGEGAQESGPVSSFPQDPAEFDSDPRVSFSKLDGRFILETENGQEYAYDTVLRRWIPTRPLLGSSRLIFRLGLIAPVGILQVDDDLLRQQQEAYKVQGVDETELVSAQQLRKKRKQQSMAEEGNTQGQKKQRVNTAVFATSIPVDADFEEIRSVFSKCGVIAEEIDSGRPRIKMYMDDSGNFKGEALVVYFRPESVSLAVQMLDDSDFRLGIMGPAERLKVQPADFSFKSQKEAPAKTTMKDKRKIIQKTQKLNSMLSDWDDDDPSSMTETNSRFEKIVILKHMFTLEELEKDSSAIFDIKEDIRDECSKLGEVTNVVLYDKEPDGVATVRFTDPRAAMQCVKVMNGRFFGGTRVEAYISNGREKFQKTNERRAALEDMAERGFEAEDEDERKRLDEFGTWLESSHVVENRAK